MIRTVEDYRLPKREEARLDVSTGPSPYASVHSLFEYMTSHLAVVTVLAGSLKGWIYIDDPARPRTAILLPPNRHRGLDPVEWLSRNSRASSGGIEKALA